MQEGGMRDPSGADSICGGGDVDVRPTLHTLSSEDDGDPWSARGGVCGFLTPLSTKLLCLPPVALMPLPPSQHLHARACRPASLLDREHAVPAWQVLASASTAAEEEQREGVGRVASTSSNTTLYTPARGNVHLRSAVDDAIVYSPLTLDDISPILCLSEERLAHRRMRVVECDRRPSAEVDDEEHWADEAFAATSPSTPPRPFRALTPAESRGDEEDISGMAPDLPTQYPAGSVCFLHEEALRLLTFTCEDEHDHLLQRPGEGSGRGASCRCGSDLGKSPCTR
ncbi:hypothetical protein, unknown function [Leishmania donovani]|uniref:Uncharacterized protein n=4 Tax=Leishmania donovani species complex TaxID=38574 RepID=E9BK03_LEIDO|nr:hypothetical protein, unknown function [Leishmania donovani]CBZ35687.1 hypothetical protein, unknown function [Leishmania donovani]